MTSFMTSWFGGGKPNNNDDLDAAGAAAPVLNPNLATASPINDYSPGHSFSTSQQPPPQQFNPQQPPPQQFNPQQPLPQQFNPQQFNPQQFNPQQFNPQHQQQQPLFTPQQLQIPNVPPPTTNDLISAAVLSQISGDTSQLQQAGQSFLISKTRSWFSWLTFDPFRPYFSIDHAYIRARLLSITFPFKSLYTRKLHTFNPMQSHYLANPQMLAQNPQYRKHHLAYQQTTYELPCFDHTQPDLYIPLMSFVTFLLINCYLSGLVKNTFDPDMLASFATLIVFLVGVELAVVKGFMFSFGISGLSILDLLGYLQLKFVGVVLAIFAWLISRSVTIFYIILTYTIFAHIWFVFQIFYHNTMIGSDQTDDIDTIAETASSQHPHQQQFEQPQQFDHTFGQNIGGFSPTPNFNGTGSTPDSNTDSNTAGKLIGLASAKITDQLNSMTKHISKRVKFLLLILIACEVIFTFILQINLPSITSTAAVAMKHAAPVIPKVTDVLAGAAATAADTVS